MFVKIALNPYKIIEFLNANKFVNKNTSILAGIFLNPLLEKSEGGNKSKAEKEEYDDRLEFENFENYLEHDY